MAEQDQQKIETVIKAFHSTIRRVGYQNVLNALAELKETDDSDKTALKFQNWIISVVCEVYNCSKTQLTRSHIRGCLLQARTMCFLLLNEHTNLYQKHIAELFQCGTNHTPVSLAKKYKQNLSEKIPEEKDFLEKYTELSIKIKEYKQTQNQPSNVSHI